MLFALGVLGLWKFISVRSFERRHSLHALILLLASESPSWYSALSCEIALEKRWNREIFVDIDFTFSKFLTVVFHQGGVMTLWKSISGRYRSTVPRLHSAFLALVQPLDRKAKSITGRSAVVLVKTSFLRFLPSKSPPI